MSSDVRRHHTLLALGFGGVLLAGSCGQPAGVVFESPERPLRWPGPPATARIEYVGQIATDRDLQPGRSLGAMIFGDEPTRSMLSPYGVCTDGGDRLFVSDSNAQVVHVFDLASRGYERWGEDADGITFAQPLGIAWDPRGWLLVADSAGGHVVVLDGAGRPRSFIGDGELTRPTGVAVHPDVGMSSYAIFVADAAAHEVVVFDGDGALRTRIGGRGTEPGRFNFPTNVAVDAAGNLYVADSLNFRVQVFDDALRPVRQIGRQGDLPGYFAQPKGIALDGDGHLYVVDAQFESVQIYDADGRFLLAVGREGHGPGEFWLPAGIHIDQNNRIWIADSYNRRVQVMDYLGEPQ